MEHVPYAYLHPFHTHLCRTFQLSIYFQAPFIYSWRRYSSNIDLSQNRDRKRYVNRYSDTALAKLVAKMGSVYIAQFDRSHRKNNIQVFVVPLCIATRHTGTLSPHWLLPYASRSISCERRRFFWRVTFGLHLYFIWIIWFWALNNETSDGYLFLRIENLVPVCSTHSTTGRQENSKE